MLKSEVRLSAEKVAELLSDEFTEYCSSGKIYNYKKGNFIDSEDNNSVQIWEIKDCSIDILAGNIILAKYKPIKHNKLKDKKICSIRSSIWKYVKIN
ncbi:hypothetical protein C8C77_12811 [Halanaerobium saccharolyticum]|uniref:Uncharacterized protein n=1 Tax=Halanaerobium saccharolyticum TaxID=43595 RepID=A0A4R7YWB1_9FIRM|nr:hypothetical protein [Halanaerobium saccharolyticum]RAK10240.1 hypothetical protein C7958_10511 [Halanaerobium saccharolyticum]TDW00452.1 hypothetical protein C8C77_12811 [Halanaerobium saccharolyticum]TDX52037.1 hypothetical protein C7956_12711 [Halanaerobium saccharolyticum]